MISLISHLRNSKIVEWTLAYLAFAWLVIQLVDVLNEVWQLSDSFQRITHLVLAFGFPVVALVAWFHGEKGKQRFTSMELLMLTALAAVAALSIPTAGRTESAIILGIPPSIILPCSIVTMLAIPVVLIAVSMFQQRGQPEPVNEQSDMKNSEMKAAESEFWKRLLQTESIEELEIMRVELDQLLAQYPESLSLRRLEVKIREARIPSHEEIRLVRSQEASDVSSRIWRELKYRRVTHVVVLFLVGGWLGVNISASVLDFLSPPVILARTLLALFVFGFSVAVVIAWYHGRSKKKGA